MIASKGTPVYAMGIDVQQNRNCPFVVLDTRYRMIESGWLEGIGGAEQSLHLLKIIERIEKSHGCRFAIGIDCPRSLLDKPRNYYWDGKRGEWRARKPTEKGWGRHCEVVVSALGLAKPQWTPLAEDAPGWMKVGCGLFDALGKRKSVYEVFPSAAYALLENLPEVRAEIEFSSCRPGPKDVLDACVGAVTVRRFVEGSGSEVGGADGLGTIVLPAPPPGPVPPGLLRIPKELLGNVP